MNINFHQGMEMITGGWWDIREQLLIAGRNEASYFHPE
jgi:hypothetical protein